MFTCFACFWIQIWSLFGIYIIINLNGTQTGKAQIKRKVFKQQAKAAKLLMVIIGLLQLEAISRKREWSGVEGSTDAENFCFASKYWNGKIIWQWDTIYEGRQDFIPKTCRTMRNWLLFEFRFFCFTFVDKLIEIKRAETILTFPLLKVKLGNLNRRLWILNLKMGIQNKEKPILGAIIIELRLIYGYRKLVKQKVIRFLNCVCDMRVF